MAPQTDMLKRYLDAGVAFTQMTQRRAEEIVRELVKAGEVQTAEAQQRVNELVAQSRENTDRLVELVRTELSARAGDLGLATKADIDALRREIAGLKGAAKKAPAKKTAAKKAPAKKAAAAKKR